MPPFCFLCQREFYQKSRPHNSDTVETHTLNLRTDYTVLFETDGSSSIINIEALNGLRQSRTFKLSCNGGQDIEKWYHELERNQCVSARSKPISNIEGSIGRRKCNGRKKVNSLFTIVPWTAVTVIPFHCREHLV